MSNPLITVALCTYNPRADYLERTLEGVRKQTLPQEEWEFLLIDNSSQPPLEGRVNLAGLPRARMVVEKEAGLSHARRRAFQESKGELIVNLDDDAVLDSDYLEKVIYLEKNFPFIGAFGCQLRSQFERQPEWPIEDYYGAERAVTEDAWSNDRQHFATTPAGAGSVIRRPVAEAYVKKMLGDPRWSLLGRTAEKLFSCEDIEIAMVACDLGMGKGVFRDLKLTHLIPEHKMTEQFQCKNAYGNGYSSVLHSYLRQGFTEPAPSIPAKINRIYRLLRMSARKRREAMAKDRGTREARKFIQQTLAKEGIKSP